MTRQRKEEPPPIHKRILCDFHQSGKKIKSVIARRVDIGGRLLQMEIEGKENSIITHPAFYCGEMRWGVYDGELRITIDDADIEIFCNEL